MVTESLQYPWTWSSSSSLPNPLQNQISVESFIGSLISLISNYGLRYEGVLSHFNLYDSTIVLLNGTIRNLQNPNLPPPFVIFSFS